MVEPLRFPEKAVEHEIDTSWAVCGTAETKGNLVTSIFLDFDQLEEFNYKIQEKYEKIKENEVDYEEYKIDDAEIVLVSYGISSRISKSAVDTARKEGIKAGLFRPKTLFPFPEKELKKIADNKNPKFISVEMSNGQMREDIKMAIECKNVELVNRMGGNILEPDDVVAKIKEVAGGR